MPLTMPQNLSDILDYRHIVLKRKWIILLCVVLVFVFTAYQVYREVPRYRTSATILLTYQPPSPLNVEEVFQNRPGGGGGGPQQGAGMVSSVALLTSRLLAERVIKRLDLQQQALFNISLQAHSFSYYLLRPATYLAKLVPQNLRKKITGVFAKEPVTQDDQSKDSQNLNSLVETYLASLQIQPSEGGLMMLAFTGTDPGLVGRILDTHLKEFIKLDLELKFETSGEARDWIENKLKEAQLRLETSELNLIQYAGENNIPPVGGDDKQGLLAQKYVNSVNLFSGLQDKITDRQNYIKVLKTMVNHPEMLELIPEDETTKQIQNLRVELLRMSTEYNNKSSEYGPDHPKMIQLQRQIENVKSQIHTEGEKMLRTAELQYNYFSGLLDIARKSKEETENELDRANKLLIQYKALKSEAESNRQVYEQVLAKLNLAKLMGNIQDAQLMSTIKVIDTPQPAVLVSGGSKINKLGRAGGMGLLFGISIAFLLEFFDTVIRNPRDISRFFKLPYLGFLPHLKESQLQDEKERTRFMTVNEPSSFTAESIRNIRTNLIFSFADRKSHAIMFTSPNPVEGKTMVSCQLAVSIAQLGKKTLLVDTDLRRPTMHHAFGVENLSGVSEVLIGEANLEDAIRTTEIYNLSLLTSGTIPPNPSELLGSEAMRQMIERVKSLYDVVFFDSPPILPVVDAIVLGRLMDGISLVARNEQTTIPSLRQSVQRLGEHHHILGIILNDLAAEKYLYPYEGYRSYPAKDEEEILPTSSTI